MASKTPLGQIGGRPMRRNRASQLSKQNVLPRLNENTTTEVQITNQLFGDYNVQKRQTVNPAMLVACLKAHGWMIVRPERR